MRRQVPIAQQLHASLFPHPSSSDPPTFQAHLARNLVPEVRIEVATFYGDLNSAEARYPGLNYCHPSHRMRLGRFPHHARLFKAFDKLGLTYNEIQDFCCWEGTKWARERYEKEEGIRVLDTTGDEIKPFMDRRELLLQRRRRRQHSDEQRRRSIVRKTDISVVVESAETSESETSSQPADEPMANTDSEAEHADVDTEHESPAEAAARLRHVAEVQARRDVSLSQQYHARIMAAWERGDVDLTPDFDKYLEEQSQSGNPIAQRILAAGRPSQRAVPAVTTAGSASPAIA